MEQLTGNHIAIEKLLDAVLKLADELLQIFAVYNEL